MRNPARGGTQRWSPVFLGLLALGLAWAGCMFDIRDPVSPPSGGGTETCPRLAPIDPDSVLANFAQAITCKLEGTSMYGEALDESFHLVLDIIDVQELAGQFDSLSKAQDVAAQEILAGDGTLPAKFVFTFGDVAADRRGTIAFYLDIPYTLELKNQSGSVVNTIKGTADVTVKDTGSGTWAITRWVDQREDPYTSFGRWHADRAVSGG